MKNTLLLFLLIPFFAFAQQKYMISGIPVLRNGTQLQNPWVGGLNNPVFSTFDLNQDSRPDLFVYDKAGWKGQAFINVGTIGSPSYLYAPQYDNIFPKELQEWALMKDYNRDGVGDIFALNRNADIMVYKGYRTGNALSYVRASDDIMYNYGAGFRDHIWTFSDNIPVMIDIDNDGDLDVLASIVGTGATLNYYQNQAVERGMSPDSLSMNMVSMCWGHFIQNSSDCGVTLAWCKTEGGGPSGQGQSRHQGGAAAGFRYRYGKPEVSLLLADIFCNTLKFLENRGDSIEAQITYADSIFPQYDSSVNLPLFPAPYLIDADNDGRDDLIVAPFASNAYQPGQAEDVKVTQYYRNTGNDSLEKFHFISNDFMTEGIVDVGTESHPVFFDYDADGLMDIVMGNYGQFQASGASKSYLALYHNTGTDTMPKYEQVSMDWNNLSVYNVLGLYPAFGDMNGDGSPDMVVGDYTGYVNFFKNASGNASGTYPSITQPRWFNLNVGQNATPFIYDVNGDSLPDLVVGSRNNNVRYYWNYGTRTVPVFSQDSSNTFFGGIRVYDYHLGQVPGYSNPIIVRENGSLVLYSGSQRGITQKFAINRDSLRAGTFTLLDSNVLGFNPGLRSTVSIADINHDGHNDYICGNIRGGMMLFSDAQWGSGPVSSVIEQSPLDTRALQVYPNPAKYKLTCRLTDESTRLIDVRMYNMLGEVMNAPIESDGAQTLTLSVGEIAAGIYTLQATDDRGQAFTHKVIIIK